MSRRLLRRSLTALAVAGLAPLFYWRILFEPSLGAEDWRSFYHFYDWIRISLTQYGTLPLYMEDAWLSSNFLANPQTPLLGPLVWLLFFLPTGAYIELLVVGYAAAGLLGMFALLSEEGANPEVALFAAVLFVFNSFFLCHLAVGHHCFLGLYLLPTLVLAFRRALLGSRVALWLAGGLNVIVLFEGSHHPFLWQNTLLLALTVLTCLQRRSIQPGRVWLLFFLASVGLGAVKLLPMFSEFGAYDPTERPPGFPPASVLWSLVVRGQNHDTEGPVDLSLGQGWGEYTCYIGWPALGGLLTGLLFGWRRWPMLLTGCLFLILSLDLGPWLGDADPGRLASRLPLWRSQRVPSRFLVVALFAFAAVGSLGLQALLARARRMPRIYPLLRVAMATLTLLVTLDLYRESRVWQEYGPGVFPESKSHVPTIKMLSLGSGSSAKIVEFTPNRFVVEARSRRGGRILLPMEPAHAIDQWSVCGGSIGITLGYLSVEAPPGTARITLRFTPRHLRLGLALTTATLCVAAITLWKGRAGTPTPGAPGLGPPSREAGANQGGSLLR